MSGKKGSELKELVQEIVEANISDTVFYTLLNVAKDKLEDEVEWEFLKTWDRTLVWNNGDNYLTSKDLPTDFRSMFGDGVIYLGPDNPYYPVPYKDIYRFRNCSNRYTIDYLNNKLYIIGSEAVSYPIYLPYLKTTDEISADTYWGFPGRFHPLLAFRVAAYYTSGVDADDIYARMSPAHRLAAVELENSLRKWNSRLALMAMDNSTGLPNQGDNPTDRLSYQDLN